MQSRVVGARGGAHEGKEQGAFPRTWVDDGCVYFIAAPSVRRVKIGVTIGHPDERFAAILTGCPVPLEKLGIVLGGIGVERKLHRRFADLRVQGEWFAFKGKLRAFVRSRLRPWPGIEVFDAKEIEDRLLNRGVEGLSILETSALTGISVSKLQFMRSRGEIEFRRQKATDPFMIPYRDVCRLHYGYDLDPVAMYEAAAGRG